MSLSSGSAFMWGTAILQGPSRDSRKKVVNNAAQPPSVSAQLKFSTAHPASSKPCSCAARFYIADDDAASLLARSLHHRAAWLYLGRAPTNPPIPPPKRVFPYTTKPSRVSPSPCSKRIQSNARPKIATSCRTARIHRQRACRLTGRD